MLSDSVRYDDKAKPSETQLNNGMEQQLEENGEQWRLLSMAVDKIMFAISTTGLAIGIVIIAFIIALVP